VPLNKNDANAKAGAFTQRVWNEITDIQYGRKTFRDWSVVVD
jgi:O6-methylguanine-DNA--protein-cysteine methyltransferase